MERLTHRINLNMIGQTAELDILYSIRAILKSQGDMNRYDKTQKIKGNSKLGTQRWKECGVEVEEVVDEYSGSDVRSPSLTVCLTKALQAYLWVMLNNKADDCTVNTNTLTPLVCPWDMGAFDCRQEVTSLLMVHPTHSVLISVCVEASESFM